MIHFDTSGFNKLIKRIKESKRKIEEGRKKYLKLLLNDPQISIEVQLRNMIKKVVYDNSKEPKVYERTYRLLVATKSKIENNHIYVYIDNDFLKQGNEFKKISRSTGQDPDAHAGGNPIGGKTYAERVEKGYTYKNPGKSYSIEARPFTQKTYEELKRKFNSGEMKIEEFLKPLFQNWSR